MATIAGCINSVHDLMGMIITQYDDNYLIKDLYKMNFERIYTFKEPYAKLLTNGIIKS